MACYYGRLNHASTCALFYVKFLASKLSGSALLCHISQAAPHSRHRLSFAPLCFRAIHSVLSRLAFASGCSECPVSDHTFPDGNFMPYLRTHSQPAGVLYAIGLELIVVCQLQVMTGSGVCLGSCSWCQCLGWVHGRVGSWKHRLGLSVCLSAGIE